MFDPLSIVMHVSPYTISGIEWQLNFPCTWFNVFDDIISMCMIQGSSCIKTD